MHVYLLLLHPSPTVVSQSIEIRQRFSGLSRYNTLYKGTRSQLKYTINVFWVYRLLVPCACDNICRATSPPEYSLFYILCIFFRRRNKNFRPYTGEPQSYPWPSKLAIIAPLKTCNNRPTRKPSMFSKFFSLFSNFLVAIHLIDNNIRFQFGSSISSRLCCIIITLPY